MPIALLKTDGSEIRFIGNADAGIQLDPSWGPGGSIVFVKLETGQDSSIIAEMRADGSNLTPILSFAGLALGPNVSPDGERILFYGLTRDTAPSRRQYRAYIVNRDGSDLRQVGPIGSTYPKWSPDGAHILMVTQQGGQSILTRLDSDGTNIVPLLAQKTRISAPTWSADGSLLAFCAGEYRATHVFTAKADGTELTQLTHDAEDLAPQFSDDCQQLYFSRFHNDATELCSISLDGTQLRRITSPTRERFCVLGGGGPAILWMLQLSSGREKESPEHVEPP